MLGCWVMGGCWNMVWLAPSMFISGMSFPPIRCGFAASKAFNSGICHGLDGMSIIAASPWTPSYMCDRALPLVTAPWDRARKMGSPGGPSSPSYSSSDTWYGAGCLADGDCGVPNQRSTAAASPAFDLLSSSMTPA